jgi:CubicO group peptidase (beta-lactamase class C family)
MANSTTSRMAYLLFSASLLVQPALAGSGDTQHDTVTRGDASLQSHGEYIDRMIADFVSKNQLPGIAMAIVQAPYIPRSAGYGRINLENDELASTKTIWNIGPITQAFTAVAILQLKEMNKLDVNAAVSKYVPNLPAEWRKVSLLELLQHSSGIPDYRDIGLIEGKKYSPTDLIDLVRGKSLLFKSGTEVRQSATDFALLGLARLIQRGAGIRWRA